MQALRLKLAHYWTSAFAEPPEVPAMFEESSTTNEEASMANLAGEAPKSWVCPSDRELALRAQLKAGWSVRTHRSPKKGNSELSEAELEQIRQVLARAEQSEQQEQERVGKLVDRLDNMQRRAVGDGENQCMLCGAEFGFFGPRGMASRCFDCRKYVCQQNCGLETVTGSGQIIFLCKLCSENREMLKKSGAWFYRDVPKYVLPATPTSNGSPRSPQPISRRISGGGLTSPRRRLPEPPISAPRRPNRILPRWADDGAEPEGACDCSSRDHFEKSLSSSDDEMTTTHRRVVQCRRFEDSESEAETPSPVSSHQDSVPSVPSPTSSSQGLPDAHHQLTAKDYVDSSDARSIDSGVMYNERCAPLVSRPSSLRPPREHDDERDSGLVSGPEHTVPPSESFQSGRLTQESASPIASISSPSHAALKKEISRSSKTGSSKKKQIKQHGADDSSPEDELNSLGTLEFSLLYLADEQKLIVKIIRAHKLRAMDANGFSDPYVKLHLLPGASKSTKLRTRTINKNLNPEWNEDLTYYGITEDDLLKKTLRLTVLDADRFGKSDFLGETRIQLKRLVNKQERKFAMYLEKHMPVEPVEKQERGKILLGLNYVTGKSALVVEVIRCSELIGMDANGYSDPYVKVHLRPDKKTYKTTVKKRTLNPEFKTEFSIPCKPDDLMKRSLEITVWDKDVGKHDDYIGGIELSQSAKGEQLRHWQDCLRNLNRRTERWHKLSEEYHPEA